MILNVDTEIKHTEKNSDLGRLRRLILKQEKTSKYRRFLSFCLCYDMIFNKIGYYFPKLLTHTLILYTAVICFLKVDIIPRGLNGFILTTLVFIQLFTYWRVINLGAGCPSEFPLLSINRVEDVMNGVEQPPDIIKNNCICVKRDGSYRFCRQCKLWKPDRSHHCSKCNKCYLKMDHHCPWFATCVGFRNQKLFVQFLCYVTIYSAYVLLLTSLEMYFWFSDAKYETELLNMHLLITWLLALLSSISTFAFSCYTIWLVTKNETTIEQYEWNSIRNDLQIYSDSLNCQTSAVNNVFDLGSRKSNFNSVMGNSWKEWLLPIQKNVVDSTDCYTNKGLFFHVKSDIYDEYRESANLQQRLLSRLSPRSSMENI